jgi:hypothetical protein
MDVRTAGILAITLFLGGLGLLHLFAKDWLWDRHETTLRGRGIVSVERTPEWDNQQNVMGGALIVVAVVVLILGNS